MKFNYEYHANILKLRKTLLDELKVTLSRRKNKTRSEHVQRVNVIAAVRVCLEQLAAQDQLDQMGAEIPRTYSTIFEPCPHTEDLPTDVYCRIKLKDADEPGILVCLDTLPFSHFSISALTLTYHDARNRRDASRELREPTRSRARSMLDFR